MVQIQLRRGDSTSWAESNPVLAPGEAAVETDTGRMKVGDGLLPWTDLDYFPSSVDSDQVIGSIPPSQVTGTAVVTSDPRLSDARTPVAHKTTHATGGSDALTPADIGAAVAGAAPAAHAGSHAAAGSDPITLAQSQVTGLATDLAGKIPASIVDAKGDLLAGSANDTVGRVSVGAIGTNPLLVPDTTAATGLKWGTWADADVARASEVGNLLPVNVATGGDTLGTTAGFAWRTAWQTVAVDTATAASITSGTTCIRVTKTTTTNTGIMLAAGCTSGPTTLTDPSLAVKAGATYTFGAMVSSDTVTHVLWAQIVWYQADGTTLISTSSGPSLTLSPTPQWAAVTTVAPAGAALCYTKLTTTNTVATGIGMLVDDLTFHRGAGGSWVPPGVPVTDLQPQLSLASAAASLTWSPAQPVLELTAAATVTLPAASTVPGAIATIRNNSTGTTTISRTSPDTIAGSLTSTTIPGKGTLRLVANATLNNWLVLDGSYTNSTVGKASYIWDHDAPGWRLIAYDSGWRDVSASIASAVLTANPDAKCYLWRGLDTARVQYFTGGASSTLTTSATIYTVPSTGFFYRHAADGARSAAPLISGGLVVGGLWMASNRFVTASALTAGADVRGDVTYPVTGTSLPSSLPGTQVTAPV